MKKSLAFIFALFALLFNARICMAEAPRALTDDEWSTLFSIMDSVQNKSDSTVWEAFQSVKYGGKVYEGFKDEANHQALIATFKHWLLEELEPYYPANLDKKDVLVNSQRQLSDTYNDKAFEATYIPNCRGKGFECLFLNVYLINKQ